MENRSLIIKDFDSSELADLKLIPDYVKNVKPIIDSNQQYQTKIYNYLNRLESLCFKINKNHISEELTYSIMAKNIIISISVLYPYFLWAGRKKDTKSTVPFSELISVYEKFSKLINQEKRIEMSMKIRENLL